MGFGLWLACVYRAGLFIIFILMANNSDLDKIMEILQKHFPKVTYISDKGNGLYEINTDNTSFLSGQSTTAIYKLEEGRVKRVEVISVSMS